MVNRAEQVQFHLEKLQADLARWKRRYDENDALIPELKRLRSPKLNLIKGRRSKAKFKVGLFEAYIATARKRLAALEDEPPQPVGMTDAEIATLHRLAEQCDVHAAGLAHNVRELYVRLTECRMKNSGKGPSGMMLSNCMERIWASYSAGTILRSMRGPSPPPRRTFVEQRRSASSRFMKNFRSAGSYSASRRAR
jgi:hypothetical protein